MKQIQEYMKELTGKSTVPRVFVNGQIIGGHDDTMKAIKDGSFDKLLFYNKENI